MAEVFRRALGARRRALLWWCAGIGAYAAMIMVFYPTIRENGRQFNELLATYPKGMLDLFTGGAAIDFTAPSSFLNTYLYGFLPIVVTVLAISLGAGELAGEEQEGTLELTLAQPIPRRSVVLGKIGVLVVGITAVVAALALVVVALAPVVGMALPGANLALASVGLVLLCVVMGSVALLAGAASGSRGLAIGVAAAVAGTGYLISGFAASVRWIEPLRFTSAFWWATNGDPLSNGVRPGNLLVLAAAALALGWATVIVFDRRDLHG